MPGGQVEWMRIVLVAGVDVDVDEFESSTKPTDSLVVAAVCSDQSVARQFRSR